MTIMLYFRVESLFKSAKLRKFLEIGDCTIFEEKTNFIHGCPEFSDVTWLKKDLNSSLPVGQLALKFCLQVQVLHVHEVCSYNDLTGRWVMLDLLSTGQLSMKSYLSGRKTYLPQKNRRIKFTLKNWPLRAPPVFWQGVTCQHCDVPRQA